MTPFSGRVLPWSARFKAAMPLAFAGACLVLFFTGIASPAIRTSAHLRPVLWTLLAGAGAFIGLWIVLLNVLAYRIVVDDRGVRLTGRTPIELGEPRSVSHGRYDNMVAYGRGALRTRDTTHLWMAVEGADGRIVVFLRLTGMFARLPDWPTAKPPATADLFDCASLDIAKLREAVASTLG